jgi:succinate dehydrogenase / fumarate reductase iron-sulfur subunit
MKVTIARFNPETNEKWLDKYDLDIKKEDRLTVMDVLKIIYNTKDSSLAFFHHSVCNHGICGRCGVRVNGKTRLACTHLITEDELLLEPKNDNVLRDLVCQSKKKGELK